MRLPELNRNWFLAKSVLEFEDIDTLGGVPVGVDQLYVVPAGTVPFVPLDGVVLNIDPEHTVVLIAVTLACGLMVTVTLNTAPVTPFDNGVTR